MKREIMRIVKASLLTLTLFSAMLGIGQVSVLTQHNDNARTGQNLSETVLNTGNVSQSNFGKLFWRTVDGYIFAQPLYIPGLSIQGATHNVVYVATAHNSVYAFDADDPNAPAPLWQVNLGTPVPSQDICIITGDTNPDDCPYLDINPEIGIISTPVIDPTAGIIYVVDRTKNTSNSTYHYFLHALDLTSGIEQLGGPVEITGQVSGTGTASQGGTLTFDPTYHNQRPSLLLLNGVVYIAFGSVGDIGGVWHGWLMSYNASTLQQEGIFSVSPNGCCGGLWSSGQGLVADAANNVYLMTGDGDFNANLEGGTEYGDSFVKFGGPNLNVTDYFTPDTQGTLFSDNEDLGAGGPMLMPGTSLLVGQGKDSVFRVVDSTNMGHYNSGVDNDVQEFTATTGPFYSSPIYWNSPNNGPVVYIWGPGDFLKAFKFTGSKFQTTPVSQGTIQNSSGFSNAAALSVSASGSLTGTGIVWSSQAPNGVATGPSLPGVVSAFDATDLTKQLWNSTQNLARDDVGNYAKFNPPTIANGKVYVGSFSGQLQVYGLNPPAASGIRFVQVAAATPQSTTVTVNIAYPGAQTAGNLNVVVVGWHDSTATVQSVTDSNGNSYALAFGPTTGTGLRQSIYYAKNIAGSGSNTVTVVFNQGATKPDVRIIEYSGVDPSNPLDVATGTSGNSNIANSGFATTTAANELVVGANIVQSNTTIVAGAPFTARIITSSDSDIAEDRLVNVPGSYYSWAPLNASGPWVMQVVTFRAAAASTVPFVNSVTPNNGPAAGGTAVTITGIDFAAGATVTFGGTAATNVVVVNSTTITATTPAGSAGAVTVTVTVNSERGSLTNGFTYITAPTVSSVSPNSGSTLGGTAVTITGTNFATGATVTFGGTAATNVVVVNSTTITATTPAGNAGAVTVTVTNLGSQSGSLANGYTYVVVPTVSSVSPNNGPVAGGTAVTITGTNFAAGATVTFGGTAATNVTVVNSTTITATTPAGSAGVVTVTVNGQSGSLTNGFTYGTVAISFAQVASATPQSPTATVALAYPGAQTAGDLNILVVGWNDTTATVQSVKDSAGNNYSLAIGPTSGTGLQQSIYYAANIVGGANTVTVTFSQAAVYPDVRILEYRGVTTPDVTAGASGSSGAANSGSAATTSANELIFGANTVATGNAAAGSGFTARIITSPDGDIAEDKVVTAAGSNSATATLTSSGPWVMQLVTFSAGPPGIYAPVNGATLTGNSATFQWYGYTGATAYWLDVGSTQGGNKYYSSGSLSTSTDSQTIYSLPSDGSTVWARWYYMLSGTWQHIDYSYTALGGSAERGVITSPAPSSTLSGSTVTFNWTPGSGASAYWVDIGSSAGGNNYYSSGNLGNVFTTAVNGLPTNGSKVYVTLYSQVGGVWLNNAYTYTAFNAAAAGVMTSPANGSTLSGSTMTFTWSAGAGASAYWLDIGSSAGGNNYDSSGNLGSALMTTATTLPTNGTSVYATLYSQIGGVWTPKAYTYTALNATSGLAVMTAPTPGSTLSANSVTFKWSADASATAYWVDIGSSAGGGNVYSSGNLGKVLTTTDFNVPANGSTIYVTLYSLVGGQWESTSCTYTEAPGAVIQNPTLGSTLTGGSAVFTWSAAGSGFTSYELTVGSTYGGNDIYISGSLSGLTTTATGLPTDGSRTVYVTLYSFNTNGSQLQNYYLYVSGP